MFNKIYNLLKKIPVISHVLARFYSLENAISRLERQVSNAIQNDFIKENKINLDDYHLYAYFKNVRAHLKVMDVTEANHNYVRIGEQDFDGGYTMLENFQDSIAYSFGICDDVSWDAHMAKKGIQVFMYDHTIKGLPYNHKNFHFNRIGILGNPEDSCSNMKTMSELIELNGHSKNKNLILKMDVEGWEWEFLNYASEKTLDQFSQIVFEFHDLTNPDMENKIIPALQKLNNTHQLVHVHANNLHPASYLADIMLPPVLEATYLRRVDFDFSESKRFFPQKIDVQNTKRWHEVILGKWN
tara:strand:- start:8246 stop:9142 length:897 start_codon:yes stop_codon:yes gene_type:complete